MSQTFDRTLQGSLIALALPDELARELWQQRDKLAAAALPAQLGEAALQARDAVAQAFIAGFRRVMWTSAALALASAGCAQLWIARAPRVEASEPITQA